MRTILNEFFVSNTELNAIDYFLESMAKTHILDEKFEILKKKNVKQKVEIDQLKKQLKSDKSFYSEKSPLNFSSLFKL